MKVEMVNYTRKYIIDKKRLEKLIKRIGELTNCRDGVVSISFVGKKRIRNINKRFRKNNKATNVISFPFLDVVAGKKIIGDIVICPIVASEEINKYGNNFVDYVTFLLIHGFLHLLGYDHIGKEDQLLMEKKEEEIFKNIPRRNFIKEAGH
ncbi:MAG: rRNA maturation RNase YbeY [Caldisericaceae bacterium]|nr:rRNA maturation RNase YbeY [Caldisericaceae bacterium]